MYPNSILDETQFLEYKPIEGYDYEQLNNQFPAPEIENQPVDEELPALEDVNNTINQFDAQRLSVQVPDLDNHDQTPFLIPEFDQLTKRIANSKLKSKSAYPDLNSPASQQLLSCSRSKFKRLPDEIVPDCAGKLSTVEIIELAAEKFIKFSTQQVNGYTMFTHPYGSSAFSSLSIDETREVELVFQLLKAAENVGWKQFDVASKFITRCGWVACHSGSPVERLVYHLCEALQKRIGKEIGIPVATKLEKQGLKNENPMAIGTNMTFLAVYQALPFNQVLHFTGIQAIIDQVGTSNQVHLIDIHIRSGVQWTLMMQALANQSSQIQLLKLTAFATTSDVQEVAETGKRLESFATTLSLPFSFKMLVLSDITEVEKNQFEVEDGEVIAVYCHMILRTMILKPQRLENMMRAIKTINPSIVVIAEVEANHTSTSFVKRFTETLFFYGAYFDCLEACMSGDNVHRSVMEGVHFADGIQNIVASEGDERMSRSVKMDTWKSFFARFGMVEIELSDSCLYQAQLVLQRFSCANYCMLENNGKCLIVGWKGTPLHSLSTWKFI
ncbi:unnamed protein product [Lactuca saligna]|uniref:DELLA protein n=1 Tax=Lactuca saligna TaxID=75948 RepID=A0AA35Z6D4_LACSI|nr:unnamed protein product [Lactuca saligna]